MMALPPHYFNFKLDQDNATRSAITNYEKIAGEFLDLSGRQHGLYEAYKLEDAESVIVVAGSTAGTAKEAVDRMCAEGKKVGLLKIKLFRPFPTEAIKNALSKAKKVAVLDKTMSFGTYPPLYQEVLSSMHDVSGMKNIHNTKYIIQSYIYGLGGRDIFVKDIEKIFEDLANDASSNEIKYIGVKN
jgi:pyruvate ferredoxin oxidoreductase alpha subunit